MKGTRKLIIAVLSLVAFTAIMLVHPVLSPLATGSGIATFVGVIIYGYSKEYKNKNEKP